MKSFSICKTRLEGLIPSKARSAYICSRLCYKSLPARAHSALIARFARSWKFFCPVCENRVPGFSPLPDFYSQELEKHSSDLRISDGETCNFKAYQCPHCGATDRDRLYALYLADRLPSTAAQQAAFCLLEIAPAAPLSRHIRRRYQIRYRTADLFQRHVDDRVDITFDGLLWGCQLRCLHLFARLGACQ